MLDASEILEKFWGYKEFRPLQAEIINSVVNGNDTLALLPTGGGKSICFQVPALALDGVCIVVSPLIALMKDQIENLKKRGIKAAAIFSGMHAREIDYTLDNFVYGDMKFLYVSPERLENELFIERVKRMKICLLAIDEAHCVSKWGYDFRPHYLKISEFKKYLPKIPTIALTATATQEVRKDISDKLGLKIPNIFVQSFARPNLSFSIFQEESKEAKLASVLNSIDGSAIVYCKTRKKTIEISNHLNKIGLNSDYYHAGLSTEIRFKKQENWIENKTRIIVSTNAFGMGIDKPDVRVVVHFEMPETIEAYYQEAGRAGRDQKKAFAVGLYSLGDFEDAQKKIDSKYPSIDFIKKIYQSLCNFYQLAIDSKPTESFDFNLNDFCSRFGLNSYETHYALKTLQDQGLIYLNDAFFNPSKLIFRVSNSQLYNFELKNPALKNVVKAILRIYGGELFSSYIQISEQEIGKTIYSTENETIQFLEFLHKNEIIDYIKQKNKSQLWFINTRFSAEYLPIDSNSIIKLKLRDKKALKSVEKYTLNKGKCRMIYLQNYFDEEGTKTCGICDNCLSWKKKNIDKDLEINYLNEIYSMIPCSIPQLISNSKLSDSDVLSAILKKQLDSMDLCLDQHGILFKI